MTEAEGTAGEKPEPTPSIGLQAAGSVIGGVIGGGLACGAMLFCGFIAYLCGVVVAEGDDVEAKTGAFMLLGAVMCALAAPFLAAFVLWAGPIAGGELLPAFRGRKADEGAHAVLIPIGLLIAVGSGAAILILTGLWNLGANTIRPEWIRTVFRLEVYAIPTLGIAAPAVTLLLIGRSDKRGRADKERIKERVCEGVAQKLPREKILMSALKTGDPATDGAILRALRGEPVGVVKNPKRLLDRIQWAEAYYRGATRGKKPAKKPSMPFQIIGRTMACPACGTANDVVRVGPAPDKSAACAKCGGALPIG